MRGDLSADEALAALDRDVDALLEKRRWLLDRDVAERRSHGRRRIESGMERGLPRPRSASERSSPRRVLDFARRPALALIAVFFLVPVAASFLLSLTDFDIYAIADRANLRFVGVAQLPRAAARPALLGGAAQHRRTSSSSPGRCRSPSRSPRRCWSPPPAVRWQGPLPHALLPAGRHHPGRRRGGVALPLPSALRPAELRAGARSASGRSTGSAIRAWRMPAIILMSVWKNFGFNMVIFMAGLQSIPERALRSREHRRRRTLAAVPARHAADAGADLRVRRRDDADRQLPALRRALRHDPGRPGAQHAQHRALHVRGGLPLVEPRLRRGAGLRAVRDHPRGHRADAPARRRALPARRPPRRRRAWRDDAPLRSRAVYAALLGGALLTLLPLLVDGRGVVHAHRRGQQLSAAPVAEPRRRSSTTPALFARLNLARYAANSAAGRDRDDRDLRAAQLDGRLRVRQAALRAGATASSACCVAALVIPGPDRHAAALPAAQAARADQHLLGRDHPRHGEHLRHLPGAPVRAVDSRQPARRGAHRRRRRVAHLLVARAAELPADPGHARRSSPSWAPGTTSSGR